MAFGKGRAKGYSDYYKNNDRTPGGDSDEHDYRENTYGKINLPKVKRANANTDAETDSAMSDKRKAAIRRRLQSRKAGK